MSIWSALRCRTYCRWTLQTRMQDSLLGESHCSFAFNDKKGCKTANTVNVLKSIITCLYFHFVVRVAHGKQDMGTASPHVCSTAGFSWARLPLSAKVSTATSVCHSCLVAVSVSFSTWADHRNIIWGNKCMKLSSSDYVISMAGVNPCATTQTVTQTEWAGVM